MVDLLRDPLLQLVFALALAALFGLAALHKWLVPARFAGALMAYGVPRSWTRAVGTALASLESLLSVGLLVPSFRRWAAALAIATLIGYAVVLAQAVIERREIADCGCSFGAPQAVQPALVLRNLVVAALATVLLLQPSARALGVADVSIAGFALAAVGLLYAAVNTLLANEPRTRRFLAEGGGAHG